MTTTTARLKIDKNLPALGCVGQAAGWLSSQLEDISSTHVHIDCHATSSFCCFLFWVVKFVGVFSRFFCLASFYLFLQNYNNKNFTSFCLNVAAAGGCSLICSSHTILNEDFVTAGGGYTCAGVTVLFCPHTMALRTHTVSRNKTSTNGGAHCALFVAFRTTHDDDFNGTSWELKLIWFFGECKYSFVYSVLSVRCGAALTAREGRRSIAAAVSYFSTNKGK